MCSVCLCEFLVLKHFGVDIVIFFVPWCIFVWDFLVCFFFSIALHLCWGISFLPGFGCGEDLVMLKIWLRRRFGYVEDLVMLQLGYVAVWLCWGLGLYRRVGYVWEDLVTAIHSVFSYVENFFMLRIVYLMPCLFGPKLFSCSLFTSFAFSTFISFSSMFSVFLLCFYVSLVYDIALLVLEFGGVRDCCVVAVLCSLCLASFSLELRIEWTSCSRLLSFLVYQYFVWHLLISTTL